MINWPAVQARKHFRISGFTMIELLIVLTILSILIIISIFAIQKYISRSNDAVRKTHMEKYRVALEEYHTDKGRYPNAMIFQNCGSGDWQPYLHEVFCDPTTDEPYLYQTNTNGTDYVIYINLDAEDDPSIAARGCENGCGPDNDADGQGDYEYGISSWSTIGSEGNISRLEVEPSCVQGGRAYCPPGACGTCCEGGLRCNGTGTGCYLDMACFE